MSVSGEPAPSRCRPHMRSLIHPVQTEPLKSTACVSLSLPAPQASGAGCALTVPGWVYH